MIYKLQYNKMEDDFIELPANAFSEILLPCMSSEFQRIPLTPISIKTSDENGGMIFPDFIYDDAIPLFSGKVFSEMKKVGTEHMLCIEVSITDEIQDITKQYVLALPPRINVVNDYGSIDEARCGNYAIFKSSDQSDQQIYITEDMHKVLEKIKPVGMEYYVLSDQ